MNNAEIIIAGILLGLLVVMIWTNVLVLLRLDKSASEAESAEWVPSRDVFVLQLDRPLKGEEVKVIAANLAQALESGSPIVLTEGTKLVRV